MSSQDSALPRGSLVLVTGVNGFLASHVADQLLQSGFWVRGTVRSLEKNQWVQDLFDQKYGAGKFSLVHVPDMAADNAFDEAVKGVSGIAHVASVMGDSPDPNVVIPTVITGALNALRSAAKEPGVKRFVLTSSSTAAYSPKPGVAFDITEKSWNEDAVAEAWADPPYDESRGLAVYAASKTQSEQAVWKWVEEEKPNFVVNTILPNCNFGKSLDYKHQGHPTTSGWITELFKGASTEARLSTWKPQYFVDVQDTARLHLALLTRPDIRNERVFAFAAPWNWNSLLRILRSMFPGRKFIDDIPGLEDDPSVIRPAARAEGILKEMGRPGWTGLEESLRENLEEYL
ncbi:Aldehyde reductase 2 [Lasiodiplodia theobromae]|uniref:Aldehyde reductase 2 n=1 Tax=Lasiodiplodia theobromae TaxID=45133 RepID=A0A5N5DU67_9PEZI|nr:Aldehyde reductase 2 [Lasiodiplodia theobromae]